MNEPIDEKLKSLLVEMHQLLSVINDRMKELNQENEYVIVPRKIWMIRNARDEGFGPSLSTVQLLHSKDRAIEHFRLMEGRVKPSIDPEYDDVDEDEIKSDPTLVTWHYGNIDMPDEKVDITEIDLFEDENYLDRRKEQLKQEEK